MKIQYLEEAINSIKLSGEIDPDYRVQPGITITFDHHSTFAGTVIPNGTKFYNDEYVVKRFVFDPSSGKILLTSIELTAQDGHLFESQKPSALDPGSPKDSGDGEERLPPSADESEPTSPLVPTFDNELPPPTIQPAQEDHSNQLALSGDHAQGSSCCGCIIL
jgi:hypothetical protein